MCRVGDVLPGVLDSLGITGRMEEARLLEEWTEIVGDAVSKRSRPEGLHQGVLVVEVENNVWMQEIQFHRQEIAERVRERFPGLKLKGIRLRLERKRGEE